MNKTETANQLRLAAKLIETGHPWQRYSHGAKNWIDSELPISISIAHGDKIRPILATPPDGRPLHNPDNLTAEQVGVGYRLCLVGESLPENYEFWYRQKWDEGFFPGKQVPEYECDCSCRIPLCVPWPTIATLAQDQVDLTAEQHAAVEACLQEEAPALQLPQWTYHRPGDPMPCDGHAEVEVLYADGDQDSSGGMAAQIFDWGMFFDPTCRIVGWRYAETTKTVELGPEDVPPGSVFRCLEWQKHGGYFTPSVHKSGVSWTSGTNVLYESFMALHEKNWQINRSIPLTGKWDATAWEPCSKEVAA